MNINHLNENGQTFLIRAIFNKLKGIEYITEILIKCEIDVDIIDKDGHHALFYAKENKFNNTQRLINENIEKK
jgi:hypothetical protein